MAQNTFIVLPDGKAAPAVKSMTDAAFADLANAPIFAPQKSDISIVTGYRFAAQLEVGVAVPRTESLIRHNKSNFLIEVGKATWSATKDLLSCLAVGRLGHTAEVQLQGAFFKVTTPSKIQLGILSPEQDAAVLAFPLAVSFFTGQDSDGIVVVNVANQLAISEGWEITPDAFVWRSGNELVQSYPRSVHLTLTGAKFDDGTVSTDAIYGQNVSILSDTPTVSTAVTLVLLDNQTAATKTVTLTLLPVLTGSNEVIGGIVGQNFALDIATKMNLPRASLVNFVVVAGEIPQGLTLTNGVLQGDYAVDKISTLKILVTDVAGQTAYVNLSFSIKPQANVTIDLPAAIKGTPYSYTPRFPAGFEGIALNDALPAGLSLNPVTGEFFGTVTNAVPIGATSVSVSVTVNGTTEQIILPLDVLARLVVSYSAGDNVYIILASGVPVAIRKDVLISLDIQGGSGRYTVTATNGAVVSLNNQVQFLNSGDTTITIIDRVTRLQASFVFVVTSQDAIFGYAVNRPSATARQKNRPLVCVVGNSLAVGFGRWTILDHDSNRLLRLQPIEAQNFDQVGEGTAFALFTSKTANAKLQMPRARNFVTAIGLDAAIIASTADVVFGLGRINDEELKYSVALTTVGGVRKAEIRVDNAVIENTRVTVITGQVLKVGVINDRFGFYLDGILKSSVNGDNLAFWDFIVVVKAAAVKLGGQILGLEYSILTEGATSAVGTIHPQTGLYVPSDENVSVVTVEGKILDSPNVSYQTDIVVIRGTVLESFNRAKLQNRPLYVWIADQERGDNKRLRFTEDGRPDANQIKNAVHVGKLQASGKWDAAEKRNDFSNDTGVYDTGYTLTKYTITGSVLNVMNPRIVQTLVPFIEVHNDEIGSLAFSQKASGCIKPKRVILVWESTACSENKAVWDAIEFPNAKSFTPFNWEVGSEVATQLPMSIEAYPDEATNYLWHLYRYDSQFVEI